VSIGIADRVLHALRGFRRRHGRWPLQKEIAIEIGRCRSVALRGLAKLESQGRIRRFRSQYEILRRAPEVRP
jgi:DNA-binding MarR family transcriptional regulator